MIYEAHPAADLFPMLDGKRLQELADDIKTSGLRHPIILHRGQILDGRNRYAACKLAGVTPRFEDAGDNINPWAYVWSLNGERRDLTADQRYLIWKRSTEHSEAWQEEERRIRDEGRRKLSAAKMGNAHAAKGANEKTTGEQVVQPLFSGSSSATARPTSTPAPAPKIAKTRNAKAAASKTNPGAVQRMDQLDRDRPDLAEKVMTGELPAAAAVREMKKAALVAKLEDVAAREVEAPTGQYDVIVIDPPWPMEKIERDERVNQVAFDYPVMDEAEMADLRVPTADDCHVWLWTTHKFLPMAFRLLDAWGLKYVCTFVWHKPGGFQPYGLPQYNCEMALYARKGAPQFVDTKAFSVCFEAPRTAHSEKPAAFYDVVRRVTAGRRLDMFNRRPIEGFDGWGKEAG